MKRDYRFDIARVICMTYIVAFLHLYGYVYNVISANIIPCCHILCDSCLGLFTFTSGYLLGKKYRFGQRENKIKDFRYSLFFDCFFTRIGKGGLSGMEAEVSENNAETAISISAVAFSARLRAAPITLFQVR